MAIKVTMLNGETDKRVPGLYQWDYGQTLEIEAPYLPTIVEVHFACRDMAEAIVYVCSTNLNVATVAIPDTCLEHTGEITAWVYGIEGTSGRTLYRLAIPIIARARPSRSEYIPPDVDDNYTQLISEVNEAIENITDGSVIAAKATHAVSADRATHADNAASASHAMVANSVTHPEFQDVSAFVSEAGGMYQFLVHVYSYGTNTACSTRSVILTPYEWMGVLSAYGEVGTITINGVVCVLGLTISDNTVRCYAQDLDERKTIDFDSRTGIEIKFRKI